MIHLIMSDCNWLHVIKTEGNKPQTKGDERVHKVGTHHDPSSRAFPSLHKFHTCCWSSWFPLVPSLGSLQSTSVAYSLEAFSILSSILQNMSELRSFPMFYLYVCVCVCVLCAHECGLWVPMPIHTCIRQRRISSVLLYHSDLFS